MSNDIITTGKTEYLFGERQFIGYVKFYKEDQDFGYLSSNNCGMNSDRRFWFKYQDFYIDRTSFESSVKFNQLVVFRPVSVNKKFKAINVVQYQVGLHRAIAIDTILTNNIIHLDEKQRVTIPAGRSGVRYSYATYQKEINILSLSGIQTYELIEQCYDIYRKNGGVALLLKLDNFMNAIGGDDFYCRKLKTNYPGKEKEINAVKNLLIITDSLTNKKITETHTSFRLIQEQYT